MLLTAEQWVDPRGWDGDIRMPDQKYPYELACHDALQGLNAPYVVQMRERMHRGLINNKKLQYKVYIEWCSYKDLSRLINEYRTHGMRIPECVSHDRPLCLTLADPM